MKCFYRISQNLLVAICRLYDARDVGRYSFSKCAFYLFIPLPLPAAGDDAFQFTSSSSSSFTFSFRRSAGPAVDGAGNAVTRVTAAVHPRKEKRQNFGIVKSVKIREKEKRHRHPVLLIFARSGGGPDSMIPAHRSFPSISSPANIRSANRRSLELRARDCLTLLSLSLLFANALFNWIPTTRGRPPVPTADLPSAAGYDWCTAKVVVVAVASLAEWVNGHECWTVHRSPSLSLYFSGEKDQRSRNP